MSRNTAFLFLFTVVCAVSLAACQPATPAEPTPAPAMESTAPATSDTTESTHTLAPGEQMVSVETSYMSPGGEEQVGFTLFVDEEGVITAAETNVLGKSPTTVMRQKSFAAELPTVVTGKKLSELSDVDRVGGSSLTTGAFNKALTELKAQL
ncbi:hypothetical protein H3C66_01205 [Patescibacteria group bacterium]|nr:hypothetical protein [Patescibacteria group bacterium]